MSQIGHIQEVLKKLSDDELRALIWNALGKCTENSRFVLYYIFGMNEADKRDIAI